MTTALITETEALRTWQRQGVAYVICYIRPQPDETIDFAEPVIESSSEPDCTDTNYATYRLSSYVFDRERERLAHRETPAFEVDADAIYYVFGADRLVAYTPRSRPPSWTAWEGSDGCCHCGADDPSDIPESPGP